MVKRRRPDTALRTAILSATERLLANRAFAEISVADILAEAGVSRGSFYLYFDGKHDVLVELARRAVARGQDMGSDWAADGSSADSTSTTPDSDRLDAGGERLDADPGAATRAAISAGARLWRDQAPVLRAVVETWPTDPELARFWRAEMDTFTALTAERIDRDRASGTITHHDVDSTALAATLTWAGERLYYLAASGIPPCDEPERLVDALTHLWTTALYCHAPSPPSS